MVCLSVERVVAGTHAGRGRPPVAGGGSADVIVNACVMSAFDVGAEELARASRGPAPVALARQVAMYLHHVELRQTLSEVAIRFGRDRTTVAHACRMIEERRDDPAFEAFLSALEAAIRSARALLPEAQGQG